MLIIITEFILFSFLGWIMDSVLRSIKNYRQEKEVRWVSAGYFPIPFCPIYGFGGLAIIFLFKLLSSFTVFEVILITSLAIIAIEYFGGMFCEKVLKVKLWDYTPAKFDLRGYIDLEHSIYYIIITILFYYYFYGWVLEMESVLIHLPKFLDLPTAVAFTLIAVWLVIKRNPENFLHFKTKALNLSVSEYSELVDNLKKARSRRKKKRERASKIIKKYLKQSGAKLRHNR